jgi:hypothetical protein
MSKLLRDTVPGLILGGWVVINLWVLALYIASAFFLQNKEQMTKQNFVYVVNKVYPNGLMRLTGLSLLAVIVGIMLSYGWFRFDERYKCDPNNQSQDSVKWTIKVLSKPLTLTILFLPLASTIIGFISNNDAFLLAVISVICIFYVALPLSILRKSVWGSDTGREWWIPAWPGLFPFVVLLLLIFIDALLIFLLHKSLSQLIFVVPIIFLVSIILKAFQASVLLRKPNPKELIPVIQQTLVEAFSPIASLAVKLIYCSFIVITPIMTIGAFRIFVIPAYAKISADQGQSLPSFLKYLLVCIEFFEKAPFTYAIPVEIISLLLIGRLVWQLNYQHLYGNAPN